MLNGPAATIQTQQSWFWADPMQRIQPNIQLGLMYLVYQVQVRSKAWALYYWAQHRVPNQYTCFKVRSRLNTFAKLLSLLVLNMLGWTRPLACNAQTDLFNDYAWILGPDPVHNPKDATQNSPILVDPAHEHPWQCPSES